MAAKRSEQLTLSKLAAEIEQLKAEQQWMKQVLETQGVKGPWLSPPKAAPLLGISHDRIMSELEAAESLRALGKRSDLIYGIHYRNIANVHNPETKYSTWQVHLVKLSEILMIPPDQRRLAA